MKTLPYVCIGTLFSSNEWHFSAGRHCFSLCLCGRHITVYWGEYWRGNSNAIGCLCLHEQVWESERRRKRESGKRHTHAHTYRNRDTLLLSLYREPEGARWRSKKKRETETNRKTQRNTQRNIEREMNRERHVEAEIKLWREKESEVETDPGTESVRLPWRLTDKHDPGGMRQAENFLACELPGVLLPADHKLGTSDVLYHHACIVKGLVNA